MGTYLSREKRKHPEEPEDLEEPPRKRFRLTRGPGEFDDMSFDSDDSSDFELNEEEKKILGKFREGYLEQFPNDGKDDEDEDEWENESDIAFLFQKYRPNGEGIEKLLAHCGEMGEAVSSRLKKDLFAVTASSHDGKGEEEDSLHFVPPPTKLDKVKIQNLGKRWINNLVKLYGIASKQYEWGIEDDDGSLSEFLAKMTAGEVEVKIKYEKDMEEDEELDDELNMVIEHMLLDGIAANLDSESEIFMLTESFYNIASDYTLSLYFQWPLFMEQFLKATGDKRFKEPLRPYYDLWKLGIYTVWKKDSDKFTLLCFIPDIAKK